MDRLGGDEDIFAGDGRVFESFADVFLIVVDLGCINMTVANLEC